MARETLPVALELMFGDEGGYYLSDDARPLLLEVPGHGNPSPYLETAIWASNALSECRFKRYGPELTPA